MFARLTASCLGVAVAAGLFLAACSSSQPARDVRVHRMGEPVVVGPLIYSVTETEWHSQLGEGPTARTPQHRFLLIRLSVTNSGANASGIPPMTLVDSRGQSHMEATDGEGVSEWLGYLRTIHPAQTERGRVVFDVPTGAYRLRVTSDAEPGTEQAALIDIPLQLTPGLPKIPAPR